MICFLLVVFSVVSSGVASSGGVGFKSSSTLHSTLPEETDVSMQLNDLTTSHDEVTIVPVVELETDYNHFNRLTNLDKTSNGAGTTTNFIVSRSKKDSSIDYSEITTDSILLNGIVEEASSTSDPDIVFSSGSDETIVSSTITPQEINYPSSSSSSVSTTGSSDSSESTESSTQSSDENNEANKIWNHLADIALEILRDKLIKEGADVMPMPDISQTFSTRLIFFPIFGVFVAKNGWFHNISTIQRTGDIIVTHAKKIFTFKAYLGLGVMEMGFDHYEVEFNNVGPRPSGNIEGSVGSNSIELTVAMQLGSDDCNATLVDLKVVELEDLRLKVTGFGLLNDLVSVLANDALFRNKQFIVENMENVLTRDLRIVLANLNCSKIIACIAAQL